MKAHLWKSLCQGGKACFMSARFSPDSLLLHFRDILSLSVITSTIRDLTIVLHGCVSQLHEPHCVCAKVPILHNNTNGVFPHIVTQTQVKALMLKLSLNPQTSHQRNGLTSRLSLLCW